MKIIQITPGYPPRLGGAENVVREISERLAKRGHQVEIFTSDISCKKGKLKSIKNLKINYLKSWEFAHTSIIFPLFFRLLKIPKDSIMHVHISGSAFIPEIVYLIKKIKKIPYIAHFHTSTEPSGKLGFLLPLYKKLFLKKVLRNANKVICLTKEYKDFINKKYEINKGKIVVIPNGINEDFISNKSNKDSENINLLYVGRLSIEKNISKIIEAVSLIKNKKIILNIVGEGEKKEEIKKLISDKKLNNVILHGKKTGYNLINLYDSADMFLLVSNYECLSLVLLEAMATETPIIASDILGNRSIIKNNYNGLLVKPTSKKIAEAIKKLIKNPRLRERLSKNGLKEIKKYSWNKIIKQIEKLYKI